METTNDADHLLALLSRALDQTGDVIGQVKLDQATQPTSCRSWDVRSLVNHVVDEVSQFASVTKGGERNPSNSDVIGEDWAVAFRAAADDLRDAWQAPGAQARTTKLPTGEVAATWRMNQQITEEVIHAWDIAAATDQSIDLDPELGELALAWGRENLKPQYRGDEADGFTFAPEVPIADDAPLYDRVAAMAGRDPSS
ncbi:MAG TPA: TIGR03086 family metal-binding protein [Acidimicrobiales bacterium]|jgi:uncharacterized protein (TIGR03086 family)